MISSVQHITPIMSFFSGNTVLDTVDIAFFIVDTLNYLKITIIGDVSRSQKMTMSHYVPSVFGLCVHYVWRDVT